MILWLNEFWGLIDNSQWVECNPYCGRSLRMLILINRMLYKVALNTELADTASYLLREIKYACAHTHRTQTLVLNPKKNSSWQILFSLCYKRESRAWVAVGYASDSRFRLRPWSLGSCPTSALRWPCRACLAVLSPSVSAHPGCTCACFLALENKQTLKTKPKNSILWSSPCETWNSISLFHFGWESTHPAPQICAALSVSLMMAEHCEYWFGVTSKFEWIGKFTGTDSANKVNGL